MELNNNKLQKSKKKTTFRSLLALVVISLSAGTLTACSDDGFLHYTSETASSLWEYTEKSELKKRVTPQHCKSAKSNLVSPGTYNTLQKRLNYLKKIESGTARGAESFLNSTNWAIAVDENKYSGISYSYSEGFEKPYLKWLDKVFTQSSKNGKYLAPIDKELFLSDWEYDVQKAVTYFCKLGVSKTENIEDLVSNFNSTLKSVEAFAATVPWYPAGYNGWASDESLAWRWVSGRSCNLGDSCWHAEILTLNGCENLYAELNMFDYGDNQIDWTNDTAGNIGPYSSVILEFSTYNSNAQKGRLSELNCY